MAIDVLINVVNAVEVALKFVVSVSCSVYVVSNGAVDLLMNSLVGVLTGATEGADGSS